MGKTKNYDWVAATLYQPNLSAGDLVSMGVTSDNAEMLDREAYKGMDAIKEAFTENGSFNETKFNQFYDNCLESYNTVAKQSFEQNVIDNFEYHPNAWMHHGESVDTSARFSASPNRMGTESSIRKWDSYDLPNLSDREIGQKNNVRDENGNILDYTPNDLGFFKTFGGPTYVLASYDEDEKDEEGNIIHRKGELKRDEEGMTYYEILGDRSVKGKQTLNPLDVLTVDESKINKYDFFDSDSLEKSGTKAFINTAVKVLPMMLPYVGPVYATASALFKVARVLPEMDRMVEGLISPNKADSDKALQKWENVLARFDKSVSDRAMQDNGLLDLTGEKFWNFVGDTATQLFEQQMIQDGAIKLTQAMGKVNPTLAEELSRGYLTLTSSEGIYDTFKEAGANDTIAGMATMAAMAGLNGLLRTEYMKEFLFEGNAMLDESVRTGRTQMNSVARKFIAATNTDGKGELTKAEAKGLLQKLTNLFRKGELPQGEKVGTVFMDYIQGAINEGYEETMEEGIQDMSKGLTKALEALGVNVTDSEHEKLDYGMTLNNTLERYLLAAGGGAAGGLIFHGLNRHQHRDELIKNLKNLDENSLRELTYMISEGKKDEILKYYKKMHDQGRLGSKDLSGTKFDTTIDINGKKTVEAVSADYGESQNDIVYNMLVSHVNMIDEMMKEDGVAVKSKDILANSREATLMQADMILAAQGKNPSEEEKLRLATCLEICGVNGGMLNEVNRWGAKVTKYHLEYQDAINKAIDGMDGDSKKDQEKIDEVLKNSDAVKKAKKKFEEVKKQFEDVKKGKYLDEYIQRGAFALHQDVSLGFAGIKNFDTYVAAAKGTDAKNLSKEELDDLKFEYDQYLADNNAQIWRAWDLYKGIVTNLAPELEEFNKKTDNLEFDKDIVQDTNYSQYLRLLKLFDEQRDEYLKEKENTTDPEELAEIDRHILALDAQKTTIGSRINGLTGAYSNYQQAAETAYKINVLNAKITDLDKQIEGITDEDEKKELLTQKASLVATLAGLTSSLEKMRRNGNTAAFGQLTAADGKENAWTTLHTENAGDTVAAVGQGLLAKYKAAKDTILIQDEQDLKDFFNYIFDKLQLDKLKIRAAEVDNPLYKYLKTADSIKALAKKLHNIKLSVNNGEFYKVGKDLNELQDFIKGELTDNLTTSDTTARDAFFGGDYDDYLDFISDGEYDDAIDLYNKHAAENGKPAVSTIEELDTAVKALTAQKTISPEEATNIVLKELFPEIGDKSFVDFANELLTARAECTFSPVKDLLNKFYYKINKENVSIFDLIDRNLKGIASFADLDSFLTTPDAVQTLEKAKECVGLVKQVLEGASTSLHPITGLPSISVRTANLAAQDIEMWEQRIDNIIELANRNSGKKLLENKRIAVKCKPLYIKYMTENSQKIAETLGLTSTPQDLWSAACSTTGWISSQEVTLHNYDKYEQTCLEFESALKKALPTDVSNLGRNIASLFAEDPNFWCGFSTRLTANTEKIESAQLATYLLNTFSIDAKVLATAQKKCFEDDHENNPDKAFAPVFGQREMLTGAICATLNRPMFSQFVETLNDDSDPTKYKGLAKAKDSRAANGCIPMDRMYLAMGGTGVGKSSAFLHTYAKIINMVNPKVPVEVVLLTPTTKQRDNINVKDFNCSKVTTTTVSELLADSFENPPTAEATNKTVNGKDVEKYNGMYYDENTSTIRAWAGDENKPNAKFKRKANSSKFSGQKAVRIIFADECTQTNAAQWEVLHQLAEEEDAMIIGMGDLHQQGATVEVAWKYDNTNGKIVQMKPDKNGKYKIITQSVENFVVVKSPYIEMSMRSDNMGMYDASVLFAEFFRDIEEESAKQGIPPIYGFSSTQSNMIDERFKESGSALTPRYYKKDDDSAVYGIMYASKDDAMRIMGTLAKTNSVFYCTDSASKPNYGKNIETVGYDEVQGGQNDYIVIDLNWGTPEGTINPNFVGGSAALMRTLYTLTQRARKGVIIVNDGTPNHKVLNTFLNPQEDPSCVQGFGITKQGKDEFYNWSMNGLSGCNESLQPLYDAFDAAAAKATKAAEHKGKPTVTKPTGATGGQSTGGNTGRKKKEVSEKIHAKKKGAPTAYVARAQAKRAYDEMAGKADGDHPLANPNKPTAIATETNQTAGRILNEGVILRHDKYNNEFVENSIGKKIAGADELQAADYEHLIKVIGGDVKIGYVADDTPDNATGDKKKGLGFIRHKLFKDVNDERIEISSDNFDEPKGLTDSEFNDLFAGNSDILNLKNDLMDYLENAPRIIIKSPENTELALAGIDKNVVVARFDKSTDDYIEIPIGFTDGKQLGLVYDEIGIEDSKNDGHFIKKDTNYYNRRITVEEAMAMNPNVISLGTRIYRRRGDGLEFGAFGKNEDNNGATFEIFTDNPAIAAHYGNTVWKEGRLHLNGETTKCIHSINRGVTMMGEAVTADFESIVRYSMALVQMKHAMRAGDLEAIKAWGSILNEEGQRVYGDDFNISYPTTEEELESFTKDPANPASVSNRQWHILSSPATDDINKISQGDRFLGKFLATCLSSAKQGGTGNWGATWDYAAANMSANAFINPDSSCMYKMIYADKVYTFNLTSDGKVRVDEINFEMKLGKGVTFMDIVGQALNSINTIEKLDDKDTLANIQSMSKYVKTAENQIFKISTEEVIADLFGKDLFENSNIKNSFEVPANWAPNTDMLNAMGYSMMTDPTYHFGIYVNNPGTDYGKHDSSVLTPMRNIGSAKRIMDRPVWCYTKYTYGRTIKEINKEEVSPDTKAGLARTKPIDEAKKQLKKDLDSNRMKIGEIQIDDLLANDAEYARLWRQLRDSEFADNEELINMIKHRMIDVVNDTLKNKTDGHWYGQYEFDGNTWKLKTTKNLKNCFATALLDGGITPDAINLDTDASIGRVSFFSVSLGNEIQHYRVLDNNSSTDKVTYYKVDNYDEWIALKEILTTNVPPKQTLFAKAALNYLESMMNDERKDDEALKFNATIGRNLDMNIVGPLCEYIASLNTNC